MPKLDLQHLQGTWNVTSLEMDGNAMPASMLGSARIVVEGSRFTSLGMGAVYEGDLTLDSSSTPKTFDLAFTAGPEKGNTSLGIYDVSGDAWKICLTVTGKTRPTAFATTPNSGHAFEVLHRASAAPEAETAMAASGESVPEIEGEWAMEACIQNGVPLQEEFVKMGKRVARASAITVSVAGQTILKAQFSVNRSVTPHTMDYALSTGKQQFGIYQVTDGKLTTCFGSPGQSRPADFSAVAGDGRTFAIWRQVKP